MIVWFVSHVIVAENRLNSIDLHFQLLKSCAATHYIFSEYLFRYHSNRLMYKTKLLPALELELQRVRARRNFNADTWIQNKAKALNEYMAKCGLHGIVISVSGGIDSTVTAAMASFASQ